MPEQAVVTSGERPALRVAERRAAQSRRLEEIRAAGLVRRASESPPAEAAQALPVAAVLRPLIPGGSLRRGSTIAVATEPGTGATSLLLGLLAEASATGSWCAVVGVPTLGLVAAAEAGVAVHRLPLVPYPGPDWAGVVAALLDGMDIVVTATPGQVSPQVASRLAARVRQRAAVLISLGQWPAADLCLRVTASVWHGLGQGRGRLRSRELEIRAHGRGAAARPRRARLFLTPDATVPEMPAGLLPMEFAEELRPSDPFGTDRVREVA